MVVTKRNHHTVPQFYLKAFGDAQKRIWATDLATNSGKLIPIKKATAIDSFYLIETKTGEEHQGWEDLFGLLETGASRSIRRVLNGEWPLRRDPRERLANWIAAQYLRTPKMRAYLDKTLDEWRLVVDKGGASAMKAAMQQPDIGDAEAVALWTRADNVIPRFQPQTNGGYLNAFSSLLKDTAREVYERRWQLVTWSRPCLITADEMVVPIASAGPPWHPLIGAADIVAVPLSRTALLMLCETDPTGAKPDDTATGDDHQAAMLNRMATSNAYNTVFRHPDDSPRIALSG
ncbi:MAG: DUF4238 domain-containing protein [Pseudolysinimonas sp.]